jgi:hypothetical protein
MARTYEPDTLLMPGSRVRVHLQPKRFPICYTSDWRSRVAYEDEHVGYFEYHYTCSRQRADTVFR